MEPNLFRKGGRHSFGISQTLKKVIFAFGSLSSQGWWLWPIFVIWVQIWAVSSFSHLAGIAFCWASDLILFISSLAVFQEFHWYVIRFTTSSIFIKPFLTSIEMFRWMMVTIFFSPMRWLEFPSVWRVRQSFFLTKQCHAARNLVYFPGLLQPRTRWRLFFGSLLPFTVLLSSLRLTGGYPELLTGRCELTGSKIKKDHCHLATLPCLFEPIWPRSSATKEERCGFSKFEKEI